RPARGNIRTTAHVARADRLRSKLLVLARCGRTPTFPRSPASRSSSQTPVHAPREKCMRKYALLAALAASMFLVVAIAFGADNTQTAKFTVTKTKAGTKLNPRSTGITTDLNNTGTDPS